MTLTQLHYMITLDNIRHFRRAAAHLGISQPSLSTQLGNLEADLGVKLFDRTKKPIEPTRVGEQVIGQARIIMGEAERLKLIVQGIVGEMAGQLRIGILPTLAPYLVPLTLARYSARHENVALEVHEMSEKHIVEQLKRGQLDAGIVTTSHASRGIVELPLFEEPLCCYISEGHRLYKRKKLKPADLVLEELWLLKEGNPLRDQVISMCSLDQQIQANKMTMTFESDSVEALKRLVESGHGMTVVPRLSLESPAPFKPEFVRTFMPPAPDRTVRMVYASTLLQEHLAMVLADEIKEVVVGVMGA